MVPERSQELGVNRLMYSIVTVLMSQLITPFHDVRRVHVKIKS